MHISLNRLRSSCLLFAFLFLSNLELHAQSSADFTQVLPLAIEDREGRLVTSIRPEQVEIEGQVATVQSLELDSAPRRILLILDTSGSMGDRKSLSWSNVVRFASQFALQRRGDDLIGLDTLAERDQVLVPLTSDSQSVIRQIGAITTSGAGRTMLGLALSEILERRENGLSFGDAIILVSDGNRSVAGKTDFVRLRDRLTRAGIRICLIRVPSVMDLATWPEETDASEFVKKTGGIELSMLSSLQEVRPGGTRINAEMTARTVQAAYAFARSYYRVGLKISTPIRKQTPLRLGVVDQQGKPIKGLQLNYPRFLSPPT